MTYKNGFTAGLFAGAVITLIAFGRIVVTYAESFRGWAISTLFFIFVFGSFITAYRAARGRSCLGTNADGFVAGIAFVEGIIVFLLYGFRV